MKKKILMLFFIIFTSLILKNCIMIKIEDESSIRPTFDFQKTYILKHIPLYFMAYYNVWKYEPYSISDFTSIKEFKKSKLFIARQQITLTGNNFIIEDRENNKKYKLKEDLFSSKDDKLINYSIYQEDKIIGTINQTDKYNTLLYIFNYKENTYIIQGKLNKFENSIHSFVFNIKDKNSSITLGSIYKKYLYFKEHYEIIINREYNSIEDPIFICFGVLVDQILKENGYQFVGSTTQNNIKSSKQNEFYLKDETSINSINNEDILKTKQKIEELKKAKEGEIIVFDNIFFYPNSDKIESKSLYIINEIANVLKERLNINIEIIGHTNDINDPAVELELSKKRAQMVQQYLINHGINPKKMKAYGYGSLYTKSNTIEEANRKIEIKITKKN